MLFDTELARENWRTKYKYADESPLDTFKRVARGLAEVEKREYGASDEEVEQWYEEFLHTLVNLRPVDDSDDLGEIPDEETVELSDGLYVAEGLYCTPGGRITANIGTDFDEATLWNCFRGDQSFMTRNGLRTFEEVEGSSVEVLTEEGWIESDIESFGQQEFQKVTLRPAKWMNPSDDKSSYFWPLNSNYRREYVCTSDHRWVLEDGTVTEDLSVGDTVASQVNQIDEEKIDLDHDPYREAFVHGLMYGDGYINSEHPDGSVTFGIRLCGEKAEYEDLFSNVTYPDSYDGDPFCSIKKSTKSYKRLPCGTDPVYLRGFIDGWSAADAHAFDHGSIEVGTQDEDAVEWLEEAASYAGYHVIGHRVDSDMETNYGQRSAPFHRLMISEEEHAWKVESIEMADHGKAYCAVVPEINAFTLEGGVYTGNCFVSAPVSDGEVEYDREIPVDGVDSFESLIEAEQTPDNLTNIFLSLLRASETLKSEGGYGVNFGFIRPRGTLIEGVGIRHPGVVSYMEMWDKMSEVIVKGDQDGYEDELTNYLEPETEDRLEKEMPRKGAMLAAMPVWHPDIEEFVRAKQESGRLTKFNISVLVDDDFMEAVENGEKYDLTFNGKVYKRIDARELYDLIMESTYRRAEPGILYFDNMNRNNPLLYMGPCSATNPCVTGDTWVQTNEGPRQVEDLHEREFEALVDGDSYSSVSEGFWKTGRKKVYEVKTSKGYSVKATSDHPFRFVREKSDPECDEWVDLENIEEGGSIRLSNQRGSSGWEGPGSRSEGWLIGFLVGDGTFHEKRQKVRSCLDFWDKDCSDLTEKARHFLDNADIKVDYETGEGKERERWHSEDLADLARQFGITMEEKVRVPEEIHQASSDFQRGFLRGLFDADGSVQVRDRENPSPVVKLSQSDKPFLLEIQKILLRFGVVSTLYKRREAQSRMLPDADGGRKSYHCKAQYALYITKDNLFEYDEKIGFSSDFKSGRLKDRLKDYTRGPKREVFSDQVVSVEEVGVEDVYDVTIEDVHEFDADGIRVSNCGEVPGSSFMDGTYEGKDYIQPYLEDYGEDDHFLGFTTVCLLGSVNLTQFVNEDRTFDWDLYEEKVETFARMMDNVNDIDRAPLPLYDWAIEKIRQYGMGINGLGSTLYMLGKSYGSEDGLEFTEKVNRIKDERTMEVSAELAAERGPFPMWSEDYLETPYFQDHCPVSEDIKEKARENGLRNAKRLTNPPLGNSSVICDNVSNGIEPIFNESYERTVIADAWPEGMNQDNVREILDEVEVGDATAWRGEYKGQTWYYEPQNRGLCFIETVYDYGYKWVKEHYPEDIENDEDYLVTTQNLDIGDHVRMQSVVQKWCDQSVSKTSNIPHDYPFEDFKDLYMDAWKHGLVGFTTFREGTMETVLETGDDEEEEGSDASEFDSLLDLYRYHECIPEDAPLTDEGVVIRDIDLPDEFENGPTEIVRADGNKYYCHLSYLPEDGDWPIAFWVHSNSLEDKEYVSLNRAVKEVVKLLVDKGVDFDLVYAQQEKISDDPHHVRLGKIISMALRHNIDLVEVIASIEDIEGDYVASTLTAVRKFLKGRVKDGTEVIGACDRCGSDEVVFESGCDKCLDCGYSACG